MNRRKLITVENAVLGAAAGFEVGVLFTHNYRMLIPSILCITAVLALNIVEIIKED